MKKEVRTLTTKLNIPKTRDGSVSRSRLLNLIDQGLDRKLTLICAPAGSGKTTIASEWAGCSELPVAWVSLDTYDDDFLRFWSGIVASLDQRVPGLSQQISSTLNSVNPSFYQPFIVQLLQELCNQQSRLVLLLDDYHVIESATIHASLAYFVERVPEGFHCYILSRFEPPLPLPRLIVKGDLLRIHGEDMNFTEAESAMFYRLMNLNLTDLQIRQLQQQTEGWITGMKLAALSLQEGSDFHRLIAAITGGHRYISDYLFQEVLSQQHESVQAFLKRTSILNRLCGSLCEAVSGGPNGQQLLEQLEKANLFLIPLDETRSWYRYHHLFADFLQSRLRREQPERWRELHHRAAEWFDKHLDPVEAIEHYLLSGHEAEAIRLIGDVSATIMGRSWETLFRWLSNISESMLEEKPDLYFTYVFLLIVKGDRTLSLQKIEKAETLYEQRQSLWTEKEANRYLGYLHMIKSYAAVDLLSNPDAAIEHCREYFRLIPDNDFLHHINVDTQDISVLRAFTGLGGKLRKSETFYRGILDVWQQANSPFTGVFLVGYAELMYEWNRMVEAEEMACRAYDIGQELNSAQVLAPAAVLLSKIYSARRNMNRALKLLRKTSQDLTNRQLYLWADMVDTQIVRLELHRMSSIERQSWLEHWSWLLEEDISPTYLFQAITLVRILISLERLDEAAHELERLLRLSERQDRLGERIEILMIRGWLWKKRKRVNRAASSLSHALALAEPDQYIRTFMDEGKTFAELLGICIRFRKSGILAAGDGPSFTYLKHLEDVFEREAAVVPGRGTTLKEKGNELLTNKELEVLYMLAEGMPNRQIASCMNISVGTVKTHLHRIYGKLQVKGRWEAIQHVKASDDDK